MAGNYGDRGDRGERGDRGDRMNREDRGDRGGRMGHDDGGDGKGRRGHSTGRGKYRAEFSGDHVFDYKDPLSLTRFITDGGKITPARISKLSLSLQRRVALSVKKARSLALLPSGMIAFDTSGRVEAVSPVPFEVQILFFSSK